MFETIITKFANLKNTTDTIKREVKNTYIQEAQLPQRDSASATHAFLGKLMIVHFTEHRICFTTI